MTIKEAAIDRKNNLNIIRLVASLMVLYMHSFAICLGVQDKDIMDVLTRHQAQSGGVAVYIFFIISGFLICRSYARSSSLWSYTKARFLRIWPLYFIVVTVYTFIIGALLTDYPFDVYFFSEIKEYLQALGFISSRAMLPGVFQYHYNHSMNGSIWTLMYEVLWYILVVALAPLWKRFKASIVAIYAVMLFGYMMLSGTGDSFLLNFFTLGMFFTAGMMFYLFSDRIKLSWKYALVCLGVLIACIFISDFKAAFALFGGYIIFFIAFQKKYIATWYDKVGDLSYGIYIMAFPVQQLVCEFLGHPAEVYLTTTMNPYLNMVVSLCIVAPLAWLSWHFIEQPCLNLKNK